MIQFIRSLFSRLVKRSAPLKEGIAQKNTPTSPAPKKPTDDEKIAFVDLQSYVERLKKPFDHKSACMSICADLKAVSQERNVPVRLAFSASSKYGKEGEKNCTSETIISGYEKGRWHKIRTLEVGTGSIYSLVSEMINSMGQNGWGCMNDSIDQLSTYLSQCLINSEKYVVNYCKREDGEATIRIHVFMVVDEREHRGKEIVPVPLIKCQISTQVGDTDPVTSAHYIYFHRKEKVVAKSET